MAVRTLGVGIAPVRFRVARQKTKTVSIRPRWRGSLGKIVRVGQRVRLMLVKLYTQLKQSDLHCLSAFEAIQRYLGYAPLRQLRRFGLWELELDTAADVHRILENSFYLVNPNKELHMLSQLPKANLKEGEKRVLVKVDEAESHTQTIKKIKQKTGVQLHSLHRYLIWELVGPASEDFVKNVIVSSSRTRGLLVNPVSQTFECLT